VPPGFSRVVGAASIFVTIVVNLCRIAWNSPIDWSNCSLVYAHSRADPYVALVIHTPRTDVYPADGEGLYRLYESLADVTDDVRFRNAHPVVMSVERSETVQFYRLLLY